MAHPAIRSLVAAAMLAVTAVPPAWTVAVSEAEPTPTPVSSVATPLASAPAPPTGTFRLEGWDRDPVAQTL